MKTHEGTRAPRPNGASISVDPMQTPASHKTGSRTALRTFVGMPLLAVTTMIAAMLLSGRPNAVTGAEVELHTGRGERVTALVFGAGSGLHLVHVSAARMAFQADLARGPLRVIALRAIELNARDVRDPSVVRLTARGPVVQLRRTKDGMFVNAGL